MSTNILPGSLTVTGNVSTATAGIGGNLVVGGNITVTGNLYSANVTVSGGGGGGGVTSVTAASGITSSGSTGAITISAVVANVVGVSGIGVSQAGGTFTIGVSGALSNASTTSNNIGGVVLSNNLISNTGTFSNSNGVRISTAGGRGNIFLQNLDNNHLILTTSEESGFTMPVIQAGQAYSQLKFFNSSSNEVGKIRLDASGALSNLTSSSNNIGSVVLSNGNITNNDDVNIGNLASTNSRISTLLINPVSAGGGGICQLGPLFTGEIRLTGSVNSSSQYVGINDTGRIINPSNTSNSIGGVVLSNSNISNITRIQDSGGYIDIQAGDCNSRLNSFRFDSSGFSGTGGKIYPNSNGSIQITGNSNGSNPVIINASGALSNLTSSSNNIGGVTLQNGVVTPSDVLASTNGYIRLGPVLFQWGYANVGSSADTVTFPQAHSSTAWNVVFSPAFTAPGNTINNTISGVTSSNFKILTSGDALNAYWQSIGPA